MKLTLGILAVLILASNSTAVIADAVVPEVLPDGLVLVEKDRRGEIYADPGVDWRIYTQIELDKATVAFQKNWQRELNRYPSNTRVSASDMERIKSELSELFSEVFTEELTRKGNYQMADQSGENVMRISPKIVDLFINAPDTASPGIQQSFTTQAGRMTLKLEIYDSITGDLIATTSDRQESPDRNYMQWTTRASNYADARRLLQRWARDMRIRLDEARGVAE